MKKDVKFRVTQDEYALLSAAASRFGFRSVYHLMATIVGGFIKYLKVAAFQLEEPEADDYISAEVEEMFDECVENPMVYRHEHSHTTRDGK